MGSVASAAARAVTLVAALAACARAPGPATPPPAAAHAAAAGIDTAGLRRVRFARGTTSGLVDDSLAAGAARSYLVAAAQGQVMLAQAITWPVTGRGAPSAEPEVRVYDVASGRELPTPRAEPEIWSGRLPLTGEYVVRVSASDPARYTLAVQIPRRVELAPGQPTAIFTGVAPSRAPIDFLLKAGAERTLEIVLGGAPTVGLHVYGLDDGVQLAPLSERSRLLAARLPTTQEYVVSVIPGAARAAYDLRITLR